MIGKISFLNAPAAVAAAARSRESTEGRQVLRTAVDTGQVQVSDLAYSRDLGLVVPSGARMQEPGSLFGGFRVDLRFGAPGALVKRYNLARLTPLPSVDEPSFIYLGVLGDGETALFLNPTEAAASGDAVCDPAPEDCQRVTMKKGQAALLDGADLAGEGAELPVVGVIMFAIAALLLGALAVVFVIPGLIFALELLLVLVAVGLGALGRVLFGRPWTVEARVKGTNEGGEWKVTGWRASGELVDSVAERLQATGRI